MFKEKKEKMPTIAEQNLTLLTDFYELTMGNGYFLNGFYKKQSYFDVFYRSVPDGGGFAIACGLTDVIDYVKNLHFSEGDIEFLRSKKIFDEKFLAYLRKFKFTGDIYAIPEGTTGTLPVRFTLNGNTRALTFFGGSAVTAADLAGAGVIEVWYDWFEGTLQLTSALAPATA